jgi:hypothetical protein
MADSCGRSHRRYGGRFIDERGGIWVTYAGEVAIPEQTEVWGRPERWGKQLSVRMIVVMQIKQCGSWRQQIPYRAFEMKHVYASDEFCGL